MPSCTKMRHHDLKVFTERYPALASGVMTGENRFNDRDFQVGDTVTRHEVVQGAEPGTYEYTGNKSNAVISCIDTFGCQDGYVNLSYTDRDVLLIV